MTEQEQLIDALESVEIYFKNQDLSVIGIQVQGKVLEALKRIKSSTIYKVNVFQPCEHCNMMKYCKKENSCYFDYIKNI